MSIKGFHAAVQEHVIVARRPHVRSLAVEKLGVHIDVCVFFKHQLLHECSEGTKGGRFRSPKTVYNDDGTVLVLLMRVYHKPR